ncbi:MAG: GDP-L-fucose synthase [Planctomycetes bacterium]|nr:GDP-L-fucose synthase [Planctomycetota bacterium]
MLDLPTQRILITGGAGFVGRALCEHLRGLGCKNLFTPRSADVDLRDRAQARKLVATWQPTVIIHLAARVGGIGANRANPGEYFHDNMAMGLNLIDEARQYRERGGKLIKFVQLGTVCAYPKFAPVPFREDDLWNGYPEETNAPYGIAKKALLVMLQAYRAQYGFPGIYLLPVNLYGPHDNFDLASSHVIPAMIRKFDDAKRSGVKLVKLWGDGSPTREFLYVGDAARAIVLATRQYESPEPVNLGSGEEIAMRDLAAAIGRHIGYSGAIEWDTAMPNGQPRRKLDTSRARAFGFNSTTKLEDGLRLTIAWWQANKPK